MISGVNGFFDNRTSENNFVNNAWIWNILQKTTGNTE